MKYNRELGNRLIYLYIYIKWKLIFIENITNQWGQVCISYCCVTNCSKTEQLKSTTNAYYPFLWVRNSGWLSWMLLAQGFSWGCSQVSWGCSKLRLSSSGGFVFDKVYSYGWQVHAGYWQEIFDPCHLDLCDGLLECPHNMAAGFSRANNPRQSKVEVFLFFFFNIYLAALVLVAHVGSFILAHRLSSCGTWVQ